MDDTILSGRLGITVSKSFSPCCGETLLKWFPRMIGQSHNCAYCGNHFGVVKAQEFQDSQYTGQCLEISGFLHKSRQVHLDQVWFSKSVFKTADVCTQWAKSRNIEINGGEEVDSFYCFKGIECIPGSERVIYISKGILGVIGLEKDAIGASDFSDGGSLNPGGSSEGNEEETTTPESETTTEKSMVDLVNAFFK